MLCVFALSIEFQKQFQMDVEFLQSINTSYNSSRKAVILNSLDALRF